MGLLKFAREDLNKQKFRNKQGGHLKHFSAEFKIFSSELYEVSGHQIQLMGLFKQ